jgi:hypothetical protein
MIKTEDDAFHRLGICLKVSCSRCQDRCAGCERTLTAWPTALIGGANTVVVLFLPRKRILYRYLF